MSALAFYLRNLILMVLENLISSQDHISLWKQGQACMIKYRSFQIIGLKKISI